ncbi:uncharacterized protein SPPG_06239 [Spizellomyces punctatus DAOM BR117]|uniref:Uncharacterized protein n=1 Tax=Spizellomyces punctatus (strain DAOM BR117) TaxID=645134 RepID=A0A0L0HCD0_SPIPD|nr:hypothetical protein, variant [Spizellomyces punctatus DAOM BR117]XP_016606590.1 uncharacterized protein SPPG_06239 [Spizellomyces punctatus DAOM BR117]KNC98549.1 hypothetical protein, variant [Spizellomyces punctatus DAOM BR117]KNC98550.1 hypothetical protein SPPG_06239 [Spizellomyces punctatus DAOM BR117]|eukprot:XP_016606589.1 hypothetical protein, variant [Spizellomyces punctatus DAOM BR117]
MSFLHKLCPCLGSRGSKESVHPVQEKQGNEKETKSEMKIVDVPVDDNQVVKAELTMTDEHLVVDEDFDEHIDAPILESSKVEPPLQPTTRSTHGSTNALDQSPDGPPRSKAAFTDDPSEPSIGVRGLLNRSRIKKETVEVMDVGISDKEDTLERREGQAETVKMVHPFEVEEL